jgi:hypothetical protein
MEVLESTFVSELTILPVEGNGILADAWSSIVGQAVIPFDKKARAEMLRKVSKSRSIASRIEKWTSCKDSASATESLPREDED